MLHDRDAEMERRDLQLLSICGKYLEEQQKLAQTMAELVRTRDELHKREQELERLQQAIAAPGGGNDASELHAAAEQAVPTHPNGGSSMVGPYCIL